MLLKKQVRSLLDLCVLIGVVQLILIRAHLSSICRKMSFIKKPNKVKLEYYFLPSTLVVKEEKTNHLEKKEEKKRRKVF